MLGIRTVASFNAEVRFYEDYAQQVDELAAKSTPRSISGGAIGGGAMGGTFLIFGVQLWYGLWLADNGHLVPLEFQYDASGCVVNDPYEFMDLIMVPIMAMMMVM